MPWIVFWHKINGLEYWYWKYSTAVSEHKKMLRPFLTYLNTVLLYLGLLVMPALAGAADVRVAVASNFYEVMKVLSAQYMKQTSEKIILSPGSTGKHYAQIINGAPYDIFFAADALRPSLLEQKGYSTAGSRFTYATGKLVLWSPDKHRVDANGNVLQSGDFRFLAIANPAHAPYGKAAKEVLMQRKLFGRLTKRMVRGENISQAYRFVKSGNAELGFVALSQVLRKQALIEGSAWRVPQELYPPIRQQAVIIKDSEAARQFAAFVKSEQALKVIREYGYEID